MWFPVTPHLVSVQGALAKKDESDVQVLQRSKPMGTCSILSIFRNKESSKKRKTNSSKKNIWAHQNKSGFFFVRFFSPCHSCLVRFFLSRFGAFRNKGGSKTR
jgi:hypothetical protein